MQPQNSTQLEAAKIMRIKAIAEVYDLDMQFLNDFQLQTIYRRASANQWLMVEDMIKFLKAAE